MEKLKCLKTPELERWFCCPVLARLLVCLFGFTAFGCLCVLELLFHSRLTLAGQRVAADDGDAEALPVLLDERNLVDLVSLQVGLNQNIFEQQRKQNNSSSLKVSWASLCLTEIHLWFSLNDWTESEPLHIRSVCSVSFYNQSSDNKTHRNKRQALKSKNGQRLTEPENGDVLWLRQ